ncbi:WD repeat containing protein [Parasponia andersonii]|uniref:WD repeat containing protein n=1 Tax=Parasponia andersonii TaxID=3476 RepID=A0A2P5D070_PARAD|nr:WD repeat containing protein [Parasponia andersonii]
MPMNFPSLEARYISYCNKHTVLPNSAVESGLSKAKIQKPESEKYSIAVSLDQLKDADISSLVDVLMALESSDIDAIDILQESHGSLSEENLMALMRAVDLKLRVVDLQEMSLTKELLRDLCQGGLACQVLNLRSNHIQKLDMSGKFIRLHTLNLDFCTALTSLQQDCFSCMPNLLSLSMCETRINNLWTTSAALSKLPSLKELRFQNCLCCNDTGPCPSSGEKTSFHGIESQLSLCRSCVEQSADSGDATFHSSNAGETFRDLICMDDSILMSEVGSNENTKKVELSDYLQEIGLLELSDVLPDLDGSKDFQDEIWEKAEFPANLHKQDLKNPAISARKYISHHPSPICFEKYYRDYMVASLPCLEVLDNLPITKIDRVTAKTTCRKYFEYLPYKRQPKESVVSLLHKREMGGSKMHCRNRSKPKQLLPYHDNQLFFSRSLCAAKLGSSEWSLLCPVSNFSKKFKEESKRPRPRQFEYHPSDPSLMVFGTLSGEVFVINHESGRTVSYIPCMGAMSSVLGLCWLKKYPSKLIAGSDNGSLKLFDIKHTPREYAESSISSQTVTFESFEQLTSLHANSTDEKFLASGYSKDVALYDIGSGKRLQLFTNIHREPINVAKFAYHSPYVFATSSFDRDVKMWDLRQNPLRPCFTSSSRRGNVMVCFSPDDLYLLVSAVDNEVQQLSAADGRLLMNLEIASTGSAHNYTRSYYMNGRDYIISGSCDEHVVRICCAQTGKRLRDVYLEDLESGNSMFVQSLRSDPFRVSLYSLF